MKLRRPMEEMAVRAIGIMIRTMIFHSLASSSLAASMISWGI